MRVTTEHCIVFRPADDDIAPAATYAWLKSEVNATYGGRYTITEDDNAQTVTLTKEEDHEISG